MNKKLGCELNKQPAKQPMKLGYLKIKQPDWLRVELLFWTHFVLKSCCFSCIFEGQLLLFLSFFRLLIAVFLSPRHPNASSWGKFRATFAINSDLSKFDRAARSLHYCITQWFPGACSSRMFQGHFGLSKQRCAQLLVLLWECGYSSISAKKLLCGLHFLRVYPTTEQALGFLRLKTYRCWWEWVTATLNAINSVLAVISRISYFSTDY